MDTVLTFHQQIVTQGAATPEALTSSLGEKLQSVSKDEETLYQMLVEAKQEHLFQAWPEKGSAEAAKHAFFKQVCWWIIKFLSPLRHPSGPCCY
jgi:hypothetical protein